MNTTTWVGTPTPSPAPKLASSYAPVHETAPEVLAAARRTLVANGAEDLALMLGLADA